MIVANIRLVAKSDKRDELVRSIRRILEPTRVKPGCQSCYYYQDIEDHDAFIIVEEWQTQTALDEHFVSDEYIILLSAMNLLGEPPVIRYHHVARSAGLETVEAAYKLKNLHN